MVNITNPNQAELEITEDLSSLNTILDWVRYSISRFQQSGIFYGHGTDNEWDEATSLVFQALALPVDMAESRQHLLFQAKVTDLESERILDWIEQRTIGLKPLPYISQQAWFAGIPFYVDERVLIPRSPFAELLKDKFSQWLSESPAHILDMCTGGGCIAIASAHAFEDAIVDAVDIDLEALDVASINIHEHQLDERVFPLRSDLFENLSGQKYDLIISNPPYVDAEDMLDLPDEFEHEPKLALAAGDDGLDLVELILKQAVNHMTEDAWLFVEVGNSEVHFESRFPGLEVQWCEFKHGGSGLFAVDFNTLNEFLSSSESN